MTAGIVSGMDKCGLCKRDLVVVETTDKAFAVLCPHCNLARTEEEAKKNRAWVDNHIRNLKKVKARAVDFFSVNRGRMEMESTTVHLDRLHKAYRELDNAILVSNGTGNPKKGNFMPPDRRGNTA